jgi:hypothetical protein
LQRYKREANEKREAEERQRQARQHREEQRLASNNSAAWERWVDGRIEAALARDPAFSPFQFDVLGATVADLRMELREEFELAIEETQRSFEAKLAALEQRLKAVPGKLPVVKTFQSGKVFYEGEIVVYDGATYQALRDTGQGVTQFASRALAMTD